MFMKSILTAAVIAAGVSMASAADISGAGATFPFPIYAKWADAYKKDTGNGLNYQSIGSGGGIKQIKAKTVTFGATDAPLKADELDKAGLAQFPMVMGGIVPVINLEGMKPGDSSRRPDARQHLPRQDHHLERPGDQGAQSEGQAAQSPDRRLIAPTVRAPPSTSPTTSAKVRPDWKDKVGVATTVDWPGGIGAKGNEGVANNVATTKGAIGYVEYAYAKQNKLTHASMVNKAGKVVEPTLEAFQAAAANADWKNLAGLLSDPRQRAGRQVVADDRRHLHPDVQDPS